MKKSIRIMIVIVVVGLIFFFFPKPSRKESEIELTLCKCFGFEKNTFRRVHCPLTWYYGGYGENNCVSLQSTCYGIPYGCKVEAIPQ